MKFVCDQCWSIVFLFLGFFLAGCSAHPTPGQTLQQETAFQATLPVTSPPAEPIAPTTETSIIPTLSITPASRFQFTAMEIETENQASVETAFWANDDKQIHYALASQTAPNVLAWFVYDLTTQTTSSITAPPQYDESAWQRLNILEPEAIGNPGIRGLISPSGQYVLYTGPSGTPPADEQALETLETREFWLANTDGSRKIKLFNSARVLGDAAWMPDESKAFFETGSYGPLRLDVVDIQTGDIDSVPFSVDGTWKLSPDGSRLALFGQRANSEPSHHLFIVSTSDWDEVRIVPDANNSQIGWSQDSKTLYYWLKSGGGTSLWLCSYNLIDAKKTYLLKLSELEKLSGVFEHSHFMVSADGKKILFFNSSLWLISLP